MHILPCLILSVEYEFNILMWTFLLLLLPASPLAFIDKHWTPISSLAAALLACLQGGRRTRDILRVQTDTLFTCLKAALGATDTPALIRTYAGHTQSRNVNASVCISSGCPAYSILYVVFTVYRKIIIYEYLNRLFGLLVYVSLKVVYTQ